MTRTTLLRPAAALGLLPILASPAIGQDTRFEALAELPFEQNRPTPETAETLRRELDVPAGDAGLPLGAAADQHARHEVRLGEGVRRRLQRAADLEGAARPEDAGHDAQLRRDLRHELRRHGRDRPDRVRGAAEPAGHPARFLAAADPGATAAEFVGDVGLPGPDAGKGGKFLVLPPGYNGEVPEGYYVYRSGTNNLFIFLRAFYQDPTNLTPAVELMEQAKVYPLNRPRPSASRWSSRTPRACRRTCCRARPPSAFDQLKWLLDREGRTSPARTGWASWPTSG